MTPKNNFQFLFDLEQKLLDPRVRKNPGELQTLIADDFFEYGSSGKIWSREAIIELLSHEYPFTLTTSDFQAHEISNDVVLITFIAHKVNDDATITHSRRSSLWKNVDGVWKNYFHQATIIF